MEGWNSLFGQEKSAAGHLRNHHIGVRDIFLFLGWFKETENVNGRYRYMANAPDLHVVFGYLEIGAIYTGRADVPAYARYHPHFEYFGVPDHPNNIIYEASEPLSFESTVPGWGYLSYNNNTQLTQDDVRNRTHWALPNCFREVEISYHTPNAFRNDYYSKEFIYPTDKPDTEKPFP